MTQRKNRKWIGTAIALNAAYCGGAAAADLVVAPNDTVILNNSQTGGATISTGGTLVLGSNAGSQPTLTGDLSADSGASLVGFGKVTGNVTMNSGSHIGPGYFNGVTPDTGVSNGTLTVGGSLTLTGANVDFETGFAGLPITQPGTGDSFFVNGDLNINASTLNVSVNTAGQNIGGLYRVFTYSGALTGSGLTLGTVTPGNTAVIQSLTTDGQINLLFGSAGATNLWNGNGQASGTHAGGGSGTWTANSANWNNAAATANAALNPATLAIFTGAAGTVGVSNVNGAVQAAGLQFASDRYVLSGDPITLLPTGANPPPIVVGDGTFAAGQWVETINNQLSGTSGFVKTGPGSLILTADSSAMGGTKYISDGALEIDGKLTGNLEIGQEVTLAGIGSVGTTTLQPNAVVAPGNDAHPIGTLTVNGNMNFNTGTVYQVHTDPATTTSDLIHVTGVANLGGSVAHVGQSGTYVPQRTYTILTADGGVHGVFDSVSSSFTFLTPGLTYDANNAFLTLTRNDVPFAGSGGPGNSAAAGGALDGASQTSGDAGTSGSGAAGSAPGSTPGTAAGSTPGTTAGSTPGASAGSTPVTAAGSVAGAPAGSGASQVAAVLSTMTSSQVQAALPTLSGEVHGSTVSVLQGIGDTVRTLPMDHLRENLDAESLPGPATAQAGPSQGSALPRPGDHPVWAQVFGNWRTFSSDGNASRVRESDGGLFVGADHPVGGGWRLGGALGYTGSHSSVDGLASHADTDSYSATIFGGKNFDAGPGKIRFTVGTAFTWSDIKTQRSVSSLNQLLKANYHASDAQVFSELGYALSVGNGYTIEPFVGAAWSNLRTRGFSESGGTAALDGQSESNNVATTTLGLRGENTFEVRHMQGHLHAMLGWRHAMGDVLPESTLAFGGGQNFTVSGAPIARNAAVVGLGADVQLTRDTSVGVSYGGQFGGGNTQNSGLINISWRF